jgi:TetR/AcrR family transcriptional regulator
VLRTFSRDLGVSRNRLHQRFGAKDMLWRAAVDWGFGQMMAKLDAVGDTDADAEQQLNRYITVFVTVSACYPDLLSLINIESSTPGTVSTTSVRPTSSRAATASLRVMRELLRQKRMRPIPPETLYFLITAGGAALFGSGALAGGLFPDLGAAPEIPRHARAVADTIVRGLMRQSITVPHCSATSHWPQCGPRPDERSLAGKPAGPRDDPTYRRMVNREAPADRARRDARGVIGKNPSGDLRIISESPPRGTASVPSTANDSSLRGRRAPPRNPPRPPDVRSPDCLNSLVAGHALQSRGMLYKGGF